ncbi:unnamed protein product [Phytomonas sp. Hart1]|nr:unnamed protein product [Phytomonas sp. Hart1]|eukprot:CCW71331.1 unnamed protein product [Phytomonas sp. isolate Hart1]
MANDDPGKGMDFWENRYYVSPHAVILGDVSFGGGCVVLAGARIIARSGRIQFGAFCLVEEYAEVVFDREAAALKGQSRHEAKGGVDAPDPASRGVGPPQHKSTAEMVIGDYNHLKAYAVLRNVAHVGSTNCLESFSSVGWADRAPCPHQTQAVAWGLGDLCVVAPYVVVDVGEFSKLSGKAVVESSTPAGDSAQCDARFAEGRIAPSRVTFLPRTALMDEIRQNASRAAGMQCRTKGFSVVPRYGTRSVAELGFISQTMMRSPPRVGDANEGESHDTAVACPPHPQLAAEAQARSDGPDSQGEGRLIKDVLDGYTAVWEQDEIESLRKLCKYYLITYGWTASSKQR